QLALVNGAAMLLAGAAMGLDSSWSPALLIAALVIAMTGNGLAFTAVAELAGSAWAGRALGVHNMVQNVVGATAPAMFGAIISGPGYAVGVAAAAFFALIAIAVTPPDRTPVPLVWLRARRGEA